jgi:hypothetical protein
MTERTFPTTGPIELHVSMAASDVTLVASDRADTRVTVTQRGGDAAPDHVRVSHEGDRVTVEERRGLGLRRPRGAWDVLVELPARSTARLQVGAGDIVARGDLSSVDATSGAGKIRLGRCAGVQAKTGVGDVEVGVVRGAATIKSGTGDVVVRSIEGGDLRISTGTGSIRCGIPEGVAARLDMSSGLGTVDNQLAHLDARPEATEYATIVAKTGLGDIVVERSVQAASA